MTVAKRDTIAPTSPSNLRVESTSRTSIELTWKASRDNIGVSGYDVYVNGSLSGTTRSRSYTVSGLTCGTAYTLAVDAYDAAGNKSAERSLVTSTSACPIGSAPPTTSTPATTTPAQTTTTTTTPSGGGGRRRLVARRHHDHHGRRHDHHHHDRLVAW